MPIGPSALWQGMRVQQCPFAVPVKMHACNAGTGAGPVGSHCAGPPTHWAMSASPILNRSIVHMQRAQCVCVYPCAPVWAMSRADVPEMRMLRAPSHSFSTPRPRLLA